MANAQIEIDIADISQNASNHVNIFGTTDALRFAHTQHSCVFPFSVVCTLWCLPVQQTLTLFMVFVSVHIQNHVIIYYTQHAELTTHTDKQRAHTYMHTSMYGWLWMYIYVWIAYTFRIVCHTITYFAVYNVYLCTHILICFTCLYHIV